MSGTALNIVCYNKRYFRYLGQMDKITKIMLIMTSAILRCFGHLKNVCIIKVFERSEKQSNDACYNKRHLCI